MNKESIKKLSNEKIHTTGIKNPKLVEITIAIDVDEEGRIQGIRYPNLDSILGEEYND